MLDRNFISKNPDKVRENLRRRHASDQALEALERLLSTIQKRRKLQQDTDNLRAQIKKESRGVGKLMKAGQREEAEGLRAQIRQLGDVLTSKEQARKELTQSEHDILLLLPNMLHESVPDGKGEEDNTLVEQWGEPRAFDFEPKEHHVLASEMGLLDTERAVKIAGTRFSILKGDLAKLERALINFFLDHAENNGYQELMVPYMVNRNAMIGTGQLPKFEDDMFGINATIGGGDAFLIPTAEVPVTNLHRTEILAEKDLPLLYAAFTPCFRAEAGSYGKDTHGLIRQHQFHKVEMVKITTPEQSAEQHEGLTRNAQDILESLELPYRKMTLCAGDISSNALLCYDLEVWLPGQQKYREISSCSNFGDYQARRMMLRYRPSGGGKVRFCHTINGSGLAVGRTLVAILENLQQQDGSVLIPQALQPYMRGKSRIG